MFLAFVLYHICYLGRQWIYFDVVIKNNGSGGLNITFDSTALKEDHFSIIIGIGTNLKFAPLKNKN